jgi:hypothetical protein
VIEPYEGDGVMTLTARGPSVVAFVLTGNDSAGGYGVFDMIDL